MISARHDAVLQALADDLAPRHEEERRQQNQEQPEFRLPKARRRDGRFEQRGQSPEDRAVVIAVNTPGFRDRLEQAAEPAATTTPQSRAGLFVALPSWIRMPLLLT